MNNDKAFGILGSLGMMAVCAGLPYFLNMAFFLNMVLSANIGGGGNSKNNLLPSGTITMLSHIGMFVAGLAFIMSVIGAIHNSGGRHRHNSLEDEPLYNNPDNMSSFYNNENISSYGNNITQNTNNFQELNTNETENTVSKKQNIETEEKNDNSYQEIVEKRKGPRILKS